MTFMFKCVWNSINKTFLIVSLCIIVLDDKN